MTHHSSRLKAFGLFALLLTCASAIADEFVPLSPTLPGQALAVSRNGYEVVGWTSVAGQSQAMRYLFAGSYPHFYAGAVTQLGAGAGSEANGLSEYGHFIVGGGSPNAFRWDPTPHVTTLPPLPSGGGFTFSGSKAVSTSYGGDFTSGISITKTTPAASVATLWHGNVPIALSSAISTAGGMTGDTHYIAGSVLHNFALVPAIFKNTGSAYVEQDLPTIAGKFGQGVNISDSGLVVVGGFATVDLTGTPTASQAASWTSPFTSYKLLPDVIGGSGNTAAFAANSDGAVIVGTAMDAGLHPAAAVYWDKAGVHNLQEELLAYGLARALNGWTLLAATGCSADGTIIVGYGLNGSTVQPFWCHLSRPLHLYNMLPVGSGKVIGGNSAVGVAFISLPAPTAGVDVALKSDSSYVTPVATSVHILGGHTTASFSMTTLGTSIERFANISGTYGGHSIRFVIQLEPAEMKAFTISAKSVVGGNAFAMVALINGHAPAGGSSLALTSLNTALGTVPASADFPGGGVRANATGRTLGTATTKTLLVKATYRSVSLTASISVTPAALTDVTTSASTIVGGGQITLIAHLNGSIQSGGATMTVASSNPAVIPVTTPLSIAAGAHYKAFNLHTNAVTTATSVTISVTFRSVTKSVAISVTP